MLTSNEKRFTWLKYDFESEERYYKVRMQKDLFNNWSLLKSYGGKRNNLGAFKIQSCNSYEDAMKKLKQIIRVRKSHGYVIKDKKYVSLPQICVTKFLMDAKLG